MKFESEHLDFSLILCRCFTVNTFHGMLLGWTTQASVFQWKYYQYQYVFVFTSRSGAYDTIDLVHLTGDISERWDWLDSSEVGLLFTMVSHDERVMILWYQVYLNPACPCWLWNQFSDRGWLTEMVGYHRIIELQSHSSYRQITHMVGGHPIFLFLTDTCGIVRGK